MTTVSLRPDVEAAPALELAQREPASRARGATTGTRLGARHRLHVALALADASGVLLATLAVASFGPWQSAQASTGARVGAVAATAAVILVVLAVRGAYAGAARRVAPRVADDLGSLVTGLLAAGACLLALDAVGTYRAWVPPAEIGLVLVAAALVVPVLRELSMLVAAHNPANVSRLLIVGGGAVAQYLAVRLSHSRLVHVVGIVDDAPQVGADAHDPPADAARPLGTLDDLAELCETERVDRIVVAFSGRHPARVAAVLQELRGTADIDVVVRYYELAGWESRLSDVTGLSLLNIGQSSGPVAAFIKRALDVGVAAVALALLSPLLAVVALAVWVDCGTPVLFRQVRVGRDRRTFRILKFRTMREPGSASGAPRPGRVRGPMGTTLTAVPAGRSARELRPRTPLDTVPDSSRITRVGAILRRLGIDELPQLLNVLRGDMSLVGPRPFIPEECESLEGSVERRFGVRPGMTGLWQVCGQHEVGFEELCRLDVQYGTSWSLRGDLRILARTPGRLLRGSSVVEH